ncbi:MAG: hypothetical protein LBC94_01360 [Desulfovibrio sp.]|jgi:hypothetical protein|nr:hypothetical protein [Desulfovibrio sp.]
MPDSNTDTTQRGAKSWEFPGFWESIFPWLLPHEHPYYICKRKEATLMTRDSVGKLARGVGGHIFTPSVSASRAAPLRIITAVDDVLDLSSSEQLDNMKQRLESLERENMLESEAWRKQCEPAYNGSLYKNK